MSITKVVTSFNRKDFVLCNINTHVTKLFFDGSHQIFFCFDFCISNKITILIKKVPKKLFNVHNKTLNFSHDFSFLSNHYSIVIPCFYNKVKHIKKTLINQRLIRVIFFGIFANRCESANHSFKTGVDILAGKGFVFSTNGNSGNRTKK